jgi:hypothetical protein
MWQAKWVPVLVAVWPQALAVIWLATPLVPPRLA